MAVIYLFNAQKRPKKAAKRVVELIHREGEYTAEAQLVAEEKPDYGDYFGFKCVDGRFRMFLVTRRETSNETGVCTVTGIDAALRELEGSVIKSRFVISEKTMETAAREALAGTAWQLGSKSTEAVETVYAEDAYYSTRWAVLKKIAAAGNARVVPYYEFEHGQITGRKVDIISKKPVFRGLILTRKRGARNIVITEEGTPYRRVFGLGKILTNSEPPEQLTFADVAWSVANGDPADKPAGQDYIDLPGAISGDEYVFEDKQETDPNRLMKKSFEDLLRKQKPKATGMAGVSDMEYMPGYGHRIVRMYDMAVARTEYGDTVATTIKNVVRYYVQKSLTKIEIGEEKESDLDSQIARLKMLEADTAKRAGGAGAGAKEAKEMVLRAEEKITLQSRLIEANAEAIRLRALTADVQQLEEETLTMFTEVVGEFDAINKALLLKAEQTTVDNLGNTVETLSATITMQAGKIEQKVSAGDVASVINQTPQSVLIDADKIDLRGYVTASELQATNASITNLTSGLTEALVLKANLMEAQQMNATYLSTSGLNIANISTQFRMLSMGDVVSTRILGEHATGGIDLQHSHEVTVTADGKLQLGEVSSSGGTFNIADTQFYKDGVSAAYTNGKTDWVPVKIERTAYSTTDKNVTVRAVNAAGVPVLGLEKIDASEIYTAGYNAAGGYDAGYAAGQADYQPTSITRTGYSTTNKTVTVKTSNSKRDLLTGITISASEIYTKGQTDYQPASIDRTAYDVTKKTVTVRAKNAAGVPVLAGQVISASEIYTAGYDAGYAANGAQYDKGFNDGYNQGYSDGYGAAKEDVTIGQSSFTITNTARNTFFASAKIWAKIDGETVASTTITKTQTINVGQ